MTVRENVVSYCNCEETTEQSRVMQLHWTNTSTALLDMEDVTSRYLARVNTHCRLLLLLLLLLLVVVVVGVVLSHSNPRMSDTATTNDPGANILALSGRVYRTCDRQRPNRSGAEY